ncbi:MAG: DUF5011 domain-containing protein [Nitrospiraceae bacterium]|nr:DUF5011 domain-containing protein [Nitrospiraceae bacterium]
MLNNRTIAMTRLSVFVLALALMIASSATAATYYVDATNGNDDSSGLSEAEAWQSFTKIPATSYQPGDSVLLKRGEEWRESLVISTNGTSQAPITLGAYGSGPAPVINGAERVTGWTEATANTYTATVSATPELVAFDGVKGDRMDSAGEVDAAREWFWADGVLTVYSTSTPVNIEAGSRRNTLHLYQCSYMTLKDLEIKHGFEPVLLSDALHVTVENLTVHDSAGFGGIILGAGASGRGQYNTIQDCTIYNMTSSRESVLSDGLGHGIFVWGTDICGNNTFANNLVRDGGGGGILLCDTSDNLVTGNTVHGLGYAGLVLAGMGSENNIYEKNLVYDTCHLENDCFGINFYRVGSNNTIRYNVVHDQYIFTEEEVGIPGFPERSGGIRFDGDTWIGVTDKTGNVIHNNVIYNEFEGIQVFNYSNVLITNNTVYNTKRSGIYVGSGGVEGTGNANVVKNNVIHTVEQGFIAHNNATNTTFDNNVYFDADTDAFFWNSGFVNFQTWKSLSGMDGQSVMADPLFVNVTGLDFHLRPESPCIDQAVSYGLLTQDHDGNTRPQGEGPDIGAFEAEPPVPADTTRPVIALLGSSPVQVVKGTPYSDAGATASDDTDGDLTAQIVVVNNVDTAQVGAYTITYDVSDAAGNAATQVIRTVNVVDNDAPVITMLGSATVSLSVGDTYIDAGATAQDTQDGNITSQIVTTNTVDTAVAGSYTVTYNVSDAAGNAAVPVVRTVHVADNDAPSIALLGSPSVTIEVKTAYTDAGATASDAQDGNITSAIVTVNSVNTAVLGTYTVTYNVTDSAGNAAPEVTRTVRVVDTTAPAISRAGASPLNAEAGSAYTDPGATAQDNYDGDISTALVTLNPVDTAIPGTYTVTYNATDSSGNAATEVTRTVVVADTIKPMIALVGSSEVTIEGGDPYSDAGATAQDSFGGNLTADIVTANPVNTSVPGSYTVTYNVSDTAGNAASEVTRIVHVVDTQKPAITILQD